MNEPDAKDENLARLVSLAKVAAAEPIDPVIDRLGRARFVERAGRLNHVRRFWLGWFGPIPRVAWAVAAGLVLAGFVWGLASRPLGFIVRGMPTVGTYVRAGDDRPVDVDFSDGTSIHAEAGTRLRIDDRRVRGARILLERGRAFAQVAPRAGSSWCFVAGPFEVLVKGTRFTLDWEPAAERFGLRLEEGSVEVVGPLGPGRIPVHAGQQLQANLAKRSLTVFETSQDSPVAAKDAKADAPAALAGSAAVEPHTVGMVRPPALNEEPPPASAVVPVETAPAPPQLSWSKLLAKGQFEAIVRLAERPERPNCAETCSATDLRVLAEAARYVGRTDLAENTLLALRRRFPDHPESSKAAFLLARLYEARADRGRAETWYRTYLAERPQSALAADALAGQMRVVKRARGPKAAEPLAREYLRKYPDGVHAAAAQQILQEQ
jgi:hypothetical protein